MGDDFPKHFAHWSRDAPVAVRRGWLAKEIKRDEGVAYPSNIRAEGAGRAAVGRAA